MQNHIQQQEEDHEIIINDYQQQLEFNIDNEEEAIKYGELQNIIIKNKIISAFHSIRCLFLLIKFVMDVINWYLIVEVYIVQVNFGTFFILLIYGLNDLWMLAVNESFDKQRNNIIPNNVMVTCPRFQQKSWVKQAKKELSFFHSCNNFYNFSTYSHVLVSIIMFVLSLEFESTLKEHILGHVSFYLQIIGVCISVFIPMLIIAFFYIFIMLIVVITITFDVIAFVVILGALVLLSPFICLYLKFSDKNLQGKTKLEVKIIEAYKSAECSICLEVFQLQDSIIVFPCFATHFFHQKCGLDWFQQKKNCPVCRADLSNMEQQNFQIDKTYEIVERQLLPEEEALEEDKGNLSIFILFFRLFYKQIKRRCLKLKRDILSICVAQEGLILFMLIGFNYMSNI